MNLADYLFPEAALICWNLANSRIDAYRIMKDKTIAHGINLAAYFFAAGILIWVFYPSWVALPFAAGAFFGRQIWFDIPLNLRRGLKWDYMSTANPPKAFLDRIERRIFGYNGKLATVVYGACYLVCLTIKWFVWR
jgi:hypothetical protein